MQETVCDKFELYNLDNLDQEHLKQVLDYLEESNSNLNFHHMLLDICEKCFNNQIELYIDAEYSHLQPAVRLITLSLMKRYNSKTPILFNTYQCYLKDSLKYLENDLKLAQKLNFRFGCKIVRGAYLKAEKTRAELIGGQFPIHESYESTNTSYNQ